MSLAWALVAIAQDGKPAPSAAGDATATDVPTQAAPEGDLEAAARRLSSARASERAAAERTLRQAGSEGVPLLERLARGGDRDAAARAVLILADAARSQIGGLKDAAQAALSRIADGGPTGLAGQARDAIAGPAVDSREQQLRAVLGGGRIVVNARPAIALGAIPNLPPRAFVPIEDAPPPGPLVTTRYRAGRMTVEVVRDGRRTTVAEDAGGRVHVATYDVGADAAAEPRHTYTLQSLTALRIKDLQLYTQFLEQRNARPTSTLVLRPLRPDLPALEPVDVQSWVVGLRHGIKTLDAQIAALEAPGKPADAAMKRKIADLRRARDRFVDELRTKGGTLPGDGDAPAPGADGALRGRILGRPGVK